MPKRDFTENDLNKLESDNEAFWSKLDEESDLGVVLSAGAYFENKLGNCLQQYFLGGDIAKSILSPRGPLGPFGAKLDSAYCLRIVDDKQHKALKKFGHVRNRFAHNLHTSFEDASICDQVDDFMKSYISDQDCDDSRSSSTFKSTRKMFTFTCFTIGMELSHREIDVWMHVGRYAALVPNHLDAIIAEL